MHRTDGSTVSLLSSLTPDPCSLAVSGLLGTGTPSHLLFLQPPWPTPPALRSRQQTMRLLRLVFRGPHCCTEAVPGRKFQKHQGSAVCTDESFVCTGCHGLGRCSCLTRLKTAAGRSSVSVSRVIWGDSRLVHPRDILICGQREAHWSSHEHHCCSPFCQTGRCLFGSSGICGCFFFFFFFHFKQIQNTQTMVLLTAQGSLEGGAV